MNPSVAHESADLSPETSPRRIHLDNARSAVSEGVSVALCTFNGAAYIRQQLDSIARQTKQPDEIIAGDDGSSDGTAGIIRTFHEETGIPLAQAEDSSHMGVVRNFERVIALCAGQYIALCDQDDIWLPDKLQRSVSLIQEQEEGGRIPVLVHSDLDLINKNGESMDTTFMRAQRIQGGMDDPLRVLLMHNLVTGPSVVMNRALIEQAMPFPPQVIMHDWWLALVASAAGRLIYDPVPGTRYRLHEDNVVGVTRLSSLHTARRIMLPDLLANEFGRVMSQDLALFRRHGDCMGEKLHTFMGCIPDGGTALLRASRDAEIRPQGFLRQAKCTVCMLSGHYVKYLDTEAG